MNEYNLVHQPILIEPGVKYFFKNILRKCNEKKQFLFNIAFNVGLFIAFVVIVWMILEYRKRNKVKKDDEERKKLEMNRYMLSKIKKIELENEKKRITELPAFESEYKMIHKFI